MTLKVIRYFISIIKAYRLLPPIKLRIIEVAGTSLSDTGVK